MDQNYWERSELEISYAKYVAHRSPYQTRTDSASRSFLYHVIRPVGIKRTWDGEVTFCSYYGYQLENCYIQTILFSISRDLI